MALALGICLFALPGPDFGHADDAVRGLKTLAHADDIVDGVRAERAIDNGVDAARMADNANNAVHTGDAVGAVRQGGGGVYPKIRWTMHGDSLPEKFHPESAVTLLNHRGRAVQTRIYDVNGYSIYDVDYKWHGDAAPGHGHPYPPGQPGVGHGKGAPHYPWVDIPPQYKWLPPGINPAQWV